MSKRVTMQARIDRIKPVLVGLWRFRDYRYNQLKWAATWEYRGRFYDMYPKDSPEQALDAVWRAWSKQKKAQSNRRSNAQNNRG